MELGLEGKVAIITGGASGIGLATAQYLRREGAKLLLADIRTDLLETVVAELSRDGVEVIGQATDVRSYPQCEAMVARAVEAFGGVDILVNSAGIGGPMTLFSENQLSDWEDLIRVNLAGVLYCCRAVIDQMIKRGAGRIINVASEAGKGNEKRMVVYGTTKGGVISLTRGLAIELGRYGITVNAVCPAVVRTPMTAFLTEEMEREWSKLYPLGRLGRPRDVASLVTFLASEEASWITGQAISVNGGFARS